VLAHIKKLDDCFGQFLVRVVCDCGAVREIEPETLARARGQWHSRSSRSEQRAEMDIRRGGRHRVRARPCRKRQI